MTSAAQMAANQANAQKSTGPRTPAGKAAASHNSISHGLTASGESLFAKSPALLAAFQEHEQKLRRDLGPSAYAEEFLFERWAFASFQYSRAQAYETQAECDMLDHPGDFEYERRWMRFTQMRLRLAREAAAAQKEYFALRQELLASEQTRRQMQAMAFAHQQAPPDISLDQIRQLFEQRMAQRAARGPGA
jgi:hypothetical protein